MMWEQAREDSAIAAPPALKPGKGAFCGAGFSPPYGCSAPAGSHLPSLGINTQNSFHNT